MGPLLVSRPILGIAAILPTVLFTGTYLVRGGNGLWNDFASYWLAGRLAAAGETPFDMEALGHLAVREGIVFDLGTGYSYPPPFAVAMVPLASLPFAIAATVFTTLSLLVFGIAVAAWLRDTRVWRARPEATLLAALAAGLYPPVHGSVLFGQANLLVVGAMSLGVRHWLREDHRRDVVGGIVIGLAGIVKVAPLALAVPMALASQFRAVLGVVAGAGGAMLAAWAVAPFAFDGLGRLGRLGEPDPFWTNQSINGFASRMTLETDRTVALLTALDPAILAAALLLALGIATLAILVRGRARLGTPAGVALAIALTVVAAAAGAPKNSFWNHAPALIGAGLLLAPIAPGSLRRSQRVLLMAWYALAVVQWWLDSLGSGLRSLGPASAVLSSAALLGLLALWAAVASRMLHPDWYPADR